MVSQTESENEEPVETAYSVLANIEEEDDVFVLECPSNFCPNTFLSKAIDFTSSRDIEDVKSREKFRLDCKKHKDVLHLAVPKRKKVKWANVPVKKILTAEWIVKPPQSQPRKDEDETRVPFPTNLRLRHPLLGVDWKKHLADVSKSLKRKSRKSGERTSV